MDSLNEGIGTLVDANLNEESARLQALQDGLQACSKIGVVFDDEHPHQRSPSSSMGWPLYASTCTSMLRPALSCNSTS